MRWMILFSVFFRCPEPQCDCLLRVDVVLLITQGETDHTSFYLENAVPSTLLQLQMPYHPVQLKKGGGFEEPDVP
jgi:hypothetical protein